MARSLNKVQLIGNLTRDPELRYTPQGTPVCTIGLATNRTWTTGTGEKQEASDFHRIIAWNKLAEICSQYLVKGRKAYFEGRLSTRSWTAQDGQQKTITEIIADDMIILDNKGNAVVTGGHDEPADTKPTKSVAKKDKEKSEAPVANGSEDELVPPDDIPF
jgi:single-strand DNA-binding protein